MRDEGLLLSEKLTAMKNTLGERYSMGTFIPSKFDEFITECQQLEFAQRWIPVEEELPLAYENGRWDGKRSELVLVKQLNGLPAVARMYSGYLDGNQFNDWYDSDDYMILVTHWRKIELL